MLPNSSYSRALVLRQTLRQEQDLREYRPTRRRRRRRASLQDIETATQVSSSIDMQCEPLSPTTTTTTSFDSQLAASKQDAAPSPPRRLSSKPTMRSCHNTFITLTSATILLTTTLLLLTASANFATSLDAERPTQQQQQQQAEALTSPARGSPDVQSARAMISLTDSDSSIKNVIVIKYANVTAAQDKSTLFERPKLQVFQLYNEPLSVPFIESKFSHSIQLFDVSQNQLSTLPKDLFCPLSSEVRQLNISHNLLENFDSLGLISQAGQLCLSELRVLDMSFNLIRYLPATGVATLHNLEVLDLSNNLIESLDELSLSSLFKLTKLDLSNNRIQQLPPRIFHKSSLMRVLLLQANHLQNPVNQLLLSGLISLEELDLSYNNITHIHDSAFLDKPNLRRVNLSHNLLSGLREEALRLTEQQHHQQHHPQHQPSTRTRLHHNGQHANSTISHYSRQQHVSPVEFYLSSNPFVCGCQLEWMRAISVSQPTVIKTFGDANSSGHHHGRIADLEQVKCKPTYQLHQSSPRNMVDVLTADSKNFLCRYKSHCFALCHCCEFDACDCEMICPAGCNCYYDSTWQTNIIDCSSNNHTVVPDRIPMDVSGLYLDGNNIDSLRPSNLIARKSLKALYLNSSNLQFIANRTFNGLIELQTLHLNDNRLRSLSGHEFEPLAQLKELFLQSNRLENISNQTFIYLRSLEVLDLSNNRLTSINIDLFTSIGHHNIRLRQLSIAHNWWSCQCSQINRFRQILKHKFLLNGSVNIADRNKLRCYYNSTTVGPLILDSAAPYGGSSSAAAQQQPIFASFPQIASSLSSQQQHQQNNRQQQQQQLTEINQCSEMVDDRPDWLSDVNPPVIQPQLPSVLAGHEFSPSDPEKGTPNDPPYLAESGGPSNGKPMPPSGPYLPPPSINPEQPMFTPMAPDMFGPHQYGDYNPNPQIIQPAANTMSLSAFLMLCAICVCVIVIALSIFVFMRQQQQRFNTLPQRHLIMGSDAQVISSNQQHPIQHNLSASSQSNIYAAIVSPTHGSSTIMTNNNNCGANTVGGPMFHHYHHRQPSNPASNANNFYSNSSTTASHHSKSSSTQHHNGQQHQQLASGHNYSSAANNQWQQQIYGQSPPFGHFENPYEPAQSVTYKSSIYGGVQPTSGSLYNALDSGKCQEGGGVNISSDWIKLPKVKQFMSKLVNKSLALGGYRSAGSRDELSAITSDKIYDAFLSYDKRDAPFVLQHLSAELEYGQPQYRVADRFRDLPLPSSAYLAEAITSVIACSHRTIIVLTENYLASDMCRHELQAALREAAIDRSHKIIAVVQNPNCLLDMDNEMRALLTNSPVQFVQQQQQQLVQLDGSSSSGNGSPASGDQPQFSPQQLVATLTNQTGGNQQVCTQTAQLATGRITFINYNERKFWTKIKQMMPLTRPSTQTLTLTTKN